jgi:hypothetical protein
VRFAIGILCLELVSSAFGQETGRVRAGQEQPWPPERGTVKFIGDPPPLPPALANKPPLERLCDLSDIVIDGIVTTAFPARSPSRGTLQTDFLISVSRVLKGPDTLRQIMVSQMGGSVGDFHLVTDSYALMKLGDRYILFLQNDNRPSTPRKPGIPPYYVTRSWAGLGQVVDDKIHLGTTAPGELSSYNGVAAESLANETISLVSRSRK